MKANALSVLANFERKQRLEVPLFQRQYVWSLERHWTPLWEDIERKFVQYLDGRQDSPVHFLGAMVLDQKRTPSTHVDKRQVIDGQQRLTTLQIFLAALRDFCRANNCHPMADECQKYVLNTGMMVEPEVEKFKVWPTALDRQQFDDVITSGSREELEIKHPLKRRKRARHPDPRPKMVEAYVFFYDQLVSFFLGSNGEPPLYPDYPLSVRLESAFQALRNGLQVVVIDLEQDDDAQVIFETLNSRGEPLLPADLLRNDIFLRAARGNENVERLYNSYWKPFDDPFWREEVKQGRLNRPRSDLFMQHFLTCRLAEDVPVKHLFAEYKFWVSRNKPFNTVELELQTLARQGKEFRRIVEPKSGDPVYGLASFLEAFDMRTVYPLLLAFMDAGLTDDQWERISKALESFFLRRAILNRPTKNYNRIFISLIKNLQKDGFTPENLESRLLGQSGESVDWPDDEEFQQAWVNSHIYHVLDNPKTVFILRRLSNLYTSSKMESVSLSSPLSVEHIMPQNWIESWPLPDGSKGLTRVELVDADLADQRTIATNSRNLRLQTIGNLTIVTQALNSAVSNGPWSAKREEFQKHSLLAINSRLQAKAVWDEDAIVDRSRELFAKALLMWPRPKV